MLPIRLVVVSLPAISSRMQKPSSSASSQPSSVDLRLYQCGDQILGALRPSLLSNAPEIGSHLHPVAHSAAGLKLARVHLQK